MRVKLGREQEFSQLAGFIQIGLNFFFGILSLPKKYLKEWEIDLTLMFIRKYKINNWYREISFYAHRKNESCAKWMHNRVKCKVSL